MPGVLVLATLAAAAPLAVYTVSLAVFGLPHVLAELGWVRHRFTGRFAPAALGVIGGALLGVVAGRFGRNLDLGTAAEWTPLELGLVVVLTLAGVGARTRATARVGLTAGLVGAAIGTGLVLSPRTTILLLAMLHNWTPVGLLAEGLEGAARRRVLVVCAVVFGVVPMLLTSGLPAQALAGVGVYAPDLGPLTTGGLAKQYGAYLPAAWQDASWAPHLFAALAYAQCMHYVAVLHVLPRLATQQGAPPAYGAPRWALAAAGAVCAGLVGHFLHDFGEARAWYGVAAAVHGWLEYPVLVAAVGGREKMQGPHTEAQSHREEGSIERGR